MSPDFKTIIDRIARGESLSQQDARNAFNYMMSGDATGAQIGAFLMGLRLRGETIDEIIGATQAVRAKAHTIKAPADAIDPCGTGGDGSHTYNISTAAAIVLAACGVTVAKHGNRAISSKSGSADVLETLGINIDADMENVERSIAEIGIGFMMATRHHSAMRHVGPSRTSLGTRTIFNLLGPLANPAKTKFQVIGVFDKKWTAPLAEVLGRLGSERVWVVHGADGLDELSISGPSYVSEFYQGKVTSFEVNPEEVGLSLSPISEIQGGDSEYNAAALRRMLAGEKNAFRDITLLNCAASLLVVGKAPDLAAGVKLAAEAIDSGAATAKLDQWVMLSNEEMVDE
ncbi:anthranilate phosphoribosyltransferase [Paremcibacter congregatus]|uniref:anthranilate phosphoribosyltransferase n=1 Tax=Paremcibacter congregatus TaxID=2043170 RepID=UPI003A922E77